MKDLWLPKGFFSHSLHTYVQLYANDSPLDSDRFPGGLVYLGENEVRCIVDRIRVLRRLHDKWRQSLYYLSPDVMYRLTILKSEVREEIASSLITDHLAASQ